MNPTVKIAEGRTFTRPARERAVSPGVLLGKITLPEQSISNQNCWGAMPASS